MENFVSVILKTKELDENAIVEAMLDSLDAPLAERVTDYGLFESENDTVVLRMPTPYALEEDECESFTQAFADKMFEMGYDDFDVEISLDEATVTTAQQANSIMQNPNATDAERKAAQDFYKGTVTKKGKSSAPQAQTTAPKIGNSDTTSGKPPKVAGVQSNGKLTNFNIDKSLPSVDVKNIRTGETFRVYGPPANVEKLISRPEIEKVYSGRGDAGARQELELRKQQMKTGPDGQYDGDDLGSAPTASKEIKVTLSNYADMIKRAKELAAKAKQGPDGAYDGDDLGSAPTNTGPKANSAVNTQASAPTQMMASMYSESVLLEELTDAEKKEYEAIVKGLEDLLASPDIDPPVRSEIDKTLADLKPDRNDPRKGDASADADQDTNDDESDSKPGDDSSNANQTAADNAMGKGEDKVVAPLTKSSPLKTFSQSGKGGLANDPDEVEAIKELQSSLNALGFELQADGKYGPNTIAAVKEFQEMMGLEIDGDAGPDTIGSLTSAKSTPGILEFYRDMKRMAQLITKANEGIVFETKLYEALTAEEQEEFDALYTKHKAKFDDAEYMSALPKSFTDKMSIISRHKAGAGANTPQEKAEAEQQVKAQEEQDDAAQKAAKILADAKEKYSNSESQLRKYLYMVVATQVRKKEYLVAMKILNSDPKLMDGIDDSVYAALSAKSMTKSMSASDAAIDSPKTGDSITASQAQILNTLDFDVEEGDSLTQAHVEALEKYKADLAKSGEGGNNVNQELADKVKTMNDGITSIWGTAESKISEVLSSLENESEWNELKAAYKEEYNKDLEEALRNEFNGDWFTSDEDRLENFENTVNKPLEKIGVKVEYAPEPVASEGYFRIPDDQRERFKLDTGKPKFVDLTLSNNGRSIFVYHEEDGTGSGVRIPVNSPEGEDLIQFLRDNGQTITDPSGQLPAPGEDSVDAAADTAKSNEPADDETGDETSDETGDETGDETSDETGDDDSNNNEEKGEVVSELRPVARELRKAMTVFNVRQGATDEEAIQAELEKLENKQDWLNLLATYQDEIELDLLDDLRGELNRGDFKTYVQDVLEKIDVQVDYKPQNESISEMRGAGFFEETYDDDNEFYEMYGELGIPEDEIWEAEYRGRKVKLNKPMRGDVKKFKVYVKNNKGNVIKVNFGDPNSKIKKSNPARRRSFRARHNCDNPGPKTKARYWSCRKW